MNTTEKQQVQRWMSIIGGCPESMKGTPTGDVLDDILGAYGKMIRASVLLAAASFGPDCETRPDDLYFLGALVELTHLASLIHDDIIDDAPLRRGIHSIQGKYGKDAAVYAGDFLIARINFWEAKKHCNDAAMILSDAVEKMCIGEIGQDLCRYDPSVTCEKYFNNIWGKTAALFIAAFKIGSSYGGCDEDTVRLFEEFGEHVGIMFQLRDDLIDFGFSGAQEGKKTHKDFQDGIYTLPVLKAMEDPQAKAKLLPIMEENRTRLLSEDEIREMEDIVIRYHGVDETIQELLRHGEACNDILDTLPSNESTDILRKLIALLIKVK